MTFLPQINWETVLLGGAKAPTIHRGNGIRGTQRSGIGEAGESWVDHAFGGHSGGNTQQDSQTDSNENPREVWRGGYFEGNVPLTIALADHAGRMWASGHMGLDVHNPNLANRWLRPHRSEKFLQGSTHTLYWSTRGANAGTPQSFHFSAFKVDHVTGLYTPTTLTSDLPNQVCSDGHAPPPVTPDPANPCQTFPNPASPGIPDTSAERFMDYGRECVYSQKLEVDAGLVGVTVVFQLVFNDHQDGTKHKMMSAPVQFVAQIDQQINAAATASRRMAECEWQNGAIHDVAPVTRRLKEEDGNMVDAPEDSKDGLEIPLESLPVVSDDSEDQAGHQNAENRNLKMRDELEAFNSGQYGYSPSNVNFGERMNELHPICTREPLHYSIGAGIFFRAKVHNFRMPNDVPMGALGALANLAQFADMDTMDIALAKTALGQKLSALFPKGLCTEGVCDGTLPGCPGQMVHPIQIPKVEFKLDRALNWTNVTTANAKESTAYAMALLPEFIRVTSIIAGSIINHFHSTTHMPSSGNSYYHGGNIVYVNGQKCRWTKVVDCVAQFNYRGTEYDGCTLVDHKNRGWCSVDSKFRGNWRDCELTCQDQTGAPYKIHNVSNVDLSSNTPQGVGRKLEEENSHVHESDRFVVEFDPKAVQYKVDEALIHTLVQRNAFRGIDEQDKASIVGFRLHHGDANPTEDNDAKWIAVGPERKFEVGEDTSNMGAFEMDFNIKAMKPSPVSMALPTLLAGLAVLGVAALVAGFYRSKKSQVRPYVSVDVEASAVE